MFNSNSYKNGAPIHAGDRVSVGGGFRLTPKANQPTGYIDPAQQSSSKPIDPYANAKPNNTSANSYRYASRNASSRNTAAANRFVKLIIAFMIISFVLPALFTVIAAVLSIVGDFGEIENRRNNNSGIVIPEDIETVEGDIEPEFAQALEKLKVAELDPRNSQLMHSDCLTIEQFLQENLDDEAISICKNTIAMYMRVEEDEDAGMYHFTIKDDVSSLYNYYFSTDTDFTEFGEMCHIRAKDTRGVIVTVYATAEPELEPESEPELEPETMPETTPNTTPETEPTKEPEINTGGSCIDNLDVEADDFQEKFDKCFEETQEFINNHRL